MPWRPSLLLFLLGYSLVDVGLHSTITLLRGSLGGPSKPSFDMSGCGTAKWGDCVESEIAIRSPYSEGLEKDWFGLQGCTKVSDVDKVHRTGHSSCHLHFSREVIG